ncbi:MAG: MFS transporter [Bacteroidales bacterium]
MEKPNYKRAAITALMAVFTLAICFIILGAISVELMAALEINTGQFGTLVMGLFLTSCIVQLVIGPLVDKIGYKPVAFIGFVVTSLSMVLLAMATSFTFALIACILMGVGAMSLNTVGNTLIPVVLFEGKDPARASNFGNAFFGIGYVLTPLLIVFMMDSLNMSYNIALIIIAVLLLVFLIFSLTTNYPKVSTGFEFAQAFKIFFKPAVLIAALALFCYLALEISMGTWIRSLMNELYSIKGTTGVASKTGIVLSSFGVAMMVGRFLMASIKNLTTMGSKVIILMSIVSLASILIMIVANSPALAIFAVILAGLAFAPIFPTIVGVTFGKFDPRFYGSIFGIIFSFGLLGGTFVPNIIGNLSVGSTVQQSLIIPAIMAAILIIISLFIGKVGVKKTDL